MLVVKLCFKKFILIQSVLINYLQRSAFKSRGGCKLIIKTPDWDFKVSIMIVLLFVIGYVFLFSWFGYLDQTFKSIDQMHYLGLIGYLISNNEITALSFVFTTILSMLPYWAMSNPYKLLNSSITRPAGPFSGVRCRPSVSSGPISLLIPIKNYSVPLT